MQNIAYSTFGLSGFTHLVEVTHCERPTGNERKEKPSVRLQNERKGPKSNPQGLRWDIGAVFLRVERKGRIFSRVDLGLVWVRFGTSKVQGNMGVDLPVPCCMRAGPEGKARPLNVVYLELLGISQERV